MTNQSPQKGTWSKWVAKRTGHKTLARVARHQANLGDLKGGQWNGRVSPSPVALLREVWGWRALILEVAFQKTVARYRIFLLGPLWIVLGFSLFTFGLATLWSLLQDAPIETFLAYVSVGLLAWNIVQGVLSDGCRCLHESRNLIHQSKAPLPVYPIVTLLKHVFLAAHNLLLVVPILVLFGPPLNLQMLWLAPGVVCLLFFCLSLAVTLSIAGAYLPDLAEIVGSLLRFAFFFTPIFWLTSARPDMHAIWLINPFYYAVEAIRGPLLNTSDPFFVVPILALLTVLSLFVAAIVFAGWSRGARIRV